jgi:hypothetical protein
MGGALASSHQTALVTGLAAGLSTIAAISFIVLLPEGTWLRRAPAADPARPQVPT